MYVYLFLKEFIKCI